MKQKQEKTYANDSYIYYCIQINVTKIALPVLVRPLGLLATPDWGGVVLTTAQLIA